MPARIPIETDTGLFSLDRLGATAELNTFSCTIAEYNDYLYNEATRSQVDQMALTWIFSERSTGNIAAYMSLIADVEHNESVLEFYRKNGFIPNEEMNNKWRKVISMRKDIVIQD
jgi:hypothetical protein